MAHLSICKQAFLTPRLSAGTPNILFPSVLFLFHLRVILTTDSSHLKPKGDLVFLFLPPTVWTRLMCPTIVKSVLFDDLLLFFKLIF